MAAGCWRLIVGAWKLVVGGWTLEVGSGSNALRDAGLASRSQTRERARCDRTRLRAAAEPGARRFVLAQRRVDVAVALVHARRFEERRRRDGRRASPRALDGLLEFLERGLVASARLQDAAVAIVRDGIARVQRDAARERRFRPGDVGVLEAAESFERQP